MALVTLDQARAQCKADPDTDTELQLCLDAAIADAQNFLNRNVYDDAAALNTARESVPAFLQGANDDYTAAIEAAQSVSDPFLRDAAIAAANASLRAAVCQADRITYGLIVTADIKIAILQTTASNFRNRENVVTGTGAVQLPQSAMDILYRRRRHEEL